ncbi:MAG: glycosyltransferase 87 family protein [Terracidiphilus sp.]|jgi:4-amino-4-deoxy-L-arabinose transferase-like glycosyltransferase
MESSRFLETASAIILPAFPLLAIAGLIALFLRRTESEEENRDWREVFLYAVVVWAALTFAFTELLSLVSALNSVYLAVSWGCADLILVFLWLRSRHKPALNPPARFWSLAKGLSRGQRALLVWIAFSLTVTALIAVVAPPNNYDSMTYHMGRVVHWWADQTIAFYPTNIQRQLYSNPLAEYIILQFLVLSGGSDHLVNLVQWFSFAGCAIVVSLLVRRLGGDGFTQCAAAFVVLATPICILEATSTQNDLVCALLTAATIYFLYHGKTFVSGISLGLAVLIKATAGLFVFPFLLLLFFRAPHNWRGIFRAAAKLAAIGGIAIVLNAPHTLRNMRIFHNTLGEKTQVQWIRSQTYAFRPFVANVIRNLGSELGTPIRDVNRVEDGAIRVAARALRLNLDDPRNTFFGKTFAVGAMEGDEDTSANPLPTVLFIAATIFLLASRRWRSSEVARFAILVWAGFFLFAWRLSWQPWISRLHIPFLVLSSVPTALLLGAIRKRSCAFAGAILALVAFLSLQPLLHNWNRPFLILSPRPASVFTEPRAEQYFAGRPDLRACYKSTIQSLETASCHVVGMKTTEDDWEYPLWALARSSGTPIYFEHIDVYNQTRNAPAGIPGAMCARIAIHDADPSTPITRPTWVELHRQGPDGADLESRFDCRP